LIGDDSGEENPRLDEIAARIEEIEDREENWTPETLDIAGAVLTVDYDGQVHIRRGYVRPEDLPKNTGRARAIETNEDGTGVSDEASPELPAPLVESLTAYRTAALGAELLNRPDIALAALVHTFAAQLSAGNGFRFRRYACDRSCRGHAQTTPKTKNLQQTRCLP
jgi:ParB family chromosome partitioning protein